MRRWWGRRPVGVHDVDADGGLPSGGSGGVSAVADAVSEPAGRVVTARWPMWREDLLQSASDLMDRLTDECDPSPASVLLAHEARDMIDSLIREIELLEAEDEPESAAHTGECVSARAWMAAHVIDPASADDPPVDPVGAMVACASVAYAAAPGSGGHG